VTRVDLTDHLEELGEDRDLDRTINDLQKLGWLATLHLRGVWAFVPPGESVAVDPYLDLKGWRARDTSAVFALAGEAAAWHLGYVARRFDGPPAVWLPRKTMVPHGLRTHFSVVRISWSEEDTKLVRPSPKLLRSKSLDLTAWASGLPALGPEALLVQLSVRPSSFRTWADLVPNLGVLARDCDLVCLERLLRLQSASGWQRAAYLLARSGRREDGLGLLERRPEARPMPKVALGRGTGARWSREFRINDSLVAPLQERLGKA
jgi:AbiEi antitoxin C-terminal domain